MKLFRYADHRIHVPVFFGNNFKDIEKIFMIFIPLSTKSEAIV